MGAPAHRVPLAGGWTAWKWALLRAAGFPAEQVLRLAAPGVAAAADRLLAREAELADLRRRAIERCREEPVTDETRKHAINAIKALYAGKQPRAFRCSPSLETLLEAHRLALAAVAADHGALAASWTSGSVEVGRALRELAGQPAFREAVAWQNRKVLETALAPLARHDPSDASAKARRHEQVVASYLQRYCVKNDVIGFFGPTCWIRLDGRDAPIEVAAGPSLIRKRTVYFEHWCIDALAARLSEDPALRPWLAPRRSPMVRVEGAILHAAGKRSELPLEFAWLLAACDGETPARELAARACADPTLELDGESEALHLLEQLEQKRLVSWTLELPVSGPAPDQALRRALDRVGDPDLRQRVLAQLELLEEGRRTLARAAGDADALAAAQDRLEQQFEQSTGVTAVRDSGQMYAGRTLVYEECRRDLELTVGPLVRERMAPLLALLLTSARWYTFELARRWRDELGRIHARLRSETGEGAVDFIPFYEQAAALFAPDQRKSTETVSSVRRELQARWQALLAWEPGERRVERSLAQLRAGGERAFAAPGPGWPGARFHSPDLMIGASSVAHLQRGDFFLVLGELHVGVNTPALPGDVREHEHPDELLRALDEDLPAPRVEPVLQREARGLRAIPHSLRPQDFELESGLMTRAFRPRGQVLAAAELVVELRDDRLVVRTRDARAAFDAIAFFESQLLIGASDFHFLPELPHLPRVSVDGVVVSRERWRFPPAELGFAALSSEIDRFAGARRWARSLGLPRFVFYKIPEETKPVYLDFDSPILVDLFVKQVRRASLVSLSEMLPTHEQLWLPGANGERYTSELRLAAVDPETFGA
jgi:hypothetical protein